jgi:hypothetical protein
MPDAPANRSYRTPLLSSMKLPPSGASNAIAPAQGKQAFERKRALGTWWARTPAAIGLAMIALALGLAAQEPPTVSRCGYKRWPVKIMADNDRGKVDLHPVETTIRELGNLHRARGPLPQSNRLSPTELKVYRIHGRLLRVRHEKDSDLHLLLEDPSHPE